MIGMMGSFSKRVFQIFRRSVMIRIVIEGLSNDLNS